ncbi:hypothetical protein B1R94_03775 [Mycolicibacterium litorale]|nr:hypothetical protein B1R94_03775 [Mycolicibacterium litorale]
MAVFGGSAVLMLAGFCVVGSETAASLVPAASPVLPGPMTEGETVTTTVPPSVLDIQKAAPAVKAPRYGRG